MKTEEILHRLIYLALVEIRAEAYEIENKKIFAIADLLHTIPLQLERATKGEEEIENVLASLKEKADIKEMRKWLNIYLEAAEK